MSESIFFSFFLLSMACIYILTSQNMLNILYFFELSLIAIGIIFITGSLIHQNTEGLGIALILLSIAASETAIGLILTLNYYNLRNFTTRFPVKR
jgi:NADH-quinone oxidoreductase subunit K